MANIPLEEIADGWNVPVPEDIDMEEVVAVPGAQPVIIKPITSIPAPQFTEEPVISIPETQFTQEPVISIPETQFTQEPAEEHQNDEPVEEQPKEPVEEQQNEQPVRCH